MLNHNDAETITNDLAVTCRRMVAPYVVERVGLNEEAFEVWARAFLEDTLVRTLERQDNKLDEVDKALFDGYWHALWSEYRKLRAAGASQTGRA